MRILVHLSDLHFGRVDQTLIAPLIDTVRQLEPHMVVVSGDLTQRARPAEFRAAREFLDALPAPRIVVPGNHDVPLYNVFNRFLRPLDDFRRYISEDPEPVFADDEIAVIGVNSARSLTIKNGRINEEQIARVRERLARLGRGRTKVIVTHHPFDFPDARHARDLIGRAKTAMHMFSDCGADLLLAGHLHASHAGCTAERYRFDDYSALVVQAGTATSTRERGESNSFNLLAVEPSRVEVARFAWMPAARKFAKVNTEAFEREGKGWLPARPAANE